MKRSPLKRNTRLRPRRRKRDQDVPFADEIKKRDFWACRRCQLHRGWVVIQCAHIFGKQAYPKVRYDPQNAIALCKGCHRWAHDHPFEFRDWVVGWMGQAAFDALGRRARGVES